LLPQREDLMILPSFVWVQYQRVTDGRLHRRTDGWNCSSYYISALQAMRPHCNNHEICKLCCSCWATPLLNFLKFMQFMPHFLMYKHLKFGAFPIRNDRFVDKNSNIAKSPKFLEPPGAKTKGQI